jgi:hypothetical protein
MSRFLVLFSLSVSLLQAPARPVHATCVDCGLTPEERGTVLQLALADRALMLHLEMHGEELELPAGWHEVAEIIPLLDPVFTGSVPTSDGWGNPILVRQLDEVPVLISPGSDSMLDRPDAIDRLLEEGRYSRSEFRALPGDDILFAQGEILKGPMSVLERWKRDAGDIRTLATALWAYAVDHDRFPSIPPGLHDVETIRQYIEPVYLRRVPTHDTWGHPFKVRLEPGAVLIASVGADGLADPSYESIDLDHPPVPAEPFSDASGDIVFCNSSFLSYPAVLGASFE